MERSLDRFWPRARSKVYEEPKKLVAHGLARAKQETAGRRSRHRLLDHGQGPAGARTRWTEEPGAGPSIEGPRRW